MAHKPWIAPYQMVGRDSPVVGSPGPIVGHIHLRGWTGVRKFPHPVFGSLGREVIDRECVSSPEILPALSRYFRGMFPGALTLHALRWCVGAVLVQVLVC